MVQTHIQAVLDLGAGEGSALAEEPRVSGRGG